MAAPSFRRRITRSQAEEYIGAGALFTLRRVAELTGLSPSMVQRLSKTPALPRLAHPGVESVRIAREDLVRFLLAWRPFPGNVRAGRRARRSA